LAAAVTDIKTGHIPNALTLGALGAAPLAHALAAVAVVGTARAAVVALIVSLVGAVLCGILPFMLFARGALGGGDVKLFAVIGACVGPFAGFRAELLAFVAGGAYALLLTARASRVGPVMSNVGSLLAGTRVEARAVEMTPVRFAPVIFLGALASAYLQWRTL
jgi:prepilin peptidase CpaA